MNEVLDGGPIYIQESINLDGNIDQIFSRISKKVEKMILEICKNNLIPKEQIGKPFLFKRLTKKDNEINPFMKISDIYDRIRMVDGQDYEKSYINFGRYKIYLSDAQLLKNKIEARISITLDDETNNNY
jgi:methionyl-tRNA formyltransferase